MTLTIAHLIDDLSAGGVTRMLSHMTSGAPGDPVRHQIVPVRRGAFTAPSVQADIVVSHLSVNWRSFPMLVSLRARYAGKRLIHVEHSYSEGFAIENVRARTRFATLLRASYALFDQVVAVSRAQADWLARESLVRGDAVRVISPTVELAPFLALHPARPTGARRIGAIGRFDRQKGFDLLIAAFRQAASADAELLLFGDGPEMETLKALATGDARIKFRGFAADPAVAIAECDVIAMPSRWEPYGLVALESRAAGRPLLAAPIDGLSDQIEEGGVAVGPGVDAWAVAISGLAVTDFGARIPAARRAAAAQAARFAEGWRILVAESAVREATTIAA